MAYQHNRWLTADQEGSRGQESPDAAGSWSSPYRIAGALLRWQELEWAAGEMVDACMCQHYVLTAFVWQKVWRSMTGTQRRTTFTAIAPARGGGGACSGSMSRHEGGTFSASSNREHQKARPLLQGDLKEPPERRCPHRSACLPLCRSQARQSRAAGRFEAPNDASTSSARLSSHARPQARPLPCRCAAGRVS